MRRGHQFRRSLPLPLLAFVTSPLAKPAGPLIRTYSAVEPAGGSDLSQAQPELLIDRCWYHGSAMPQRHAPIAMTLIATTAGFLPASNTLLLISTTRMKRPEVVVFWSASW